MFNFANIKPLVTRGVGRSGLLLQKHSPEILTAIGIAGVVAAGVIASHATLKLTPILEKRNENLEMSKELYANPSENADEVYTEKDHKEDVAKIHIRAGLDIARLYGPAITLGMASIGCIVAAHGIMRRRNVALAAAYKAVETAFGEYRKRVIETIGEEPEREIHANYQQVEVETEDGKTVTVHRPTNGNSPYSRLFDHRSARWQSNVEYNLHFLATQETLFNQMLHAKGHVFLNEVYDALGLERSPEGQIVGWALNDNYDPNEGDGYISFGIFEDYMKDKGKNFNNYDRTILVDFNVDGNILDKI